MEAIDVIYINKINIPPKKIKNKEYENQKDLFIIPENKEIKIVCIISINPIDKGCFMKKKIKENINKVKRKIFCKIKSENSLYKILILGINEK